MNARRYDPMIHDLRGNEVDGEYWVWIEERFQSYATAFRAAGNDRAAAIADRLAATADDVPAELVREHQEFWNSIAYIEDDDDGAKTDAAFEELDDIDDQMEEEIARGQYAPADATVFVLEFNRRASGGIRMA
jgi:hypothetical protein